MATKPRQTAFANRRVVQRAQAFVKGNNLALTGTPPAPFMSRTAPNPSPRSETNRGFVKGFLETVVTYYGSAGQVPRYDYPNPKLRPATPQSFVASTPQYYKGTDSFFTAGPPRYDWPNPISAARTVASMRYGVRMLVNNTTYVPRSEYTIKHKWPVAQQPLPVPNVALSLLGSDKFFGLGGPRYDWPNPRIKSRYVVDHIHVNKTTLTLLIDIVQKKHDWPLAPRGPARLRSANTTHQRVLIPVDNSAPRRGGIRIDVTRAKPQQPFSFPNLVVQQSTPLVRPFTSAVLPPPRTRPTTWYAGDAIINESIFEAFPFRQLDWPNPTVRKITVKYTVLGVPILTTAAPAQLPSRQLDWSLPRTKPRIAQSQYQASNLNLVGADVIFGAPGQVQTYDWPNPREVRRASVLTQWLQSTDIGLIGKDKFFGAIGQAPRYDWPNPRGKRPIPQQGIQINQVAALVEVSTYRRAYATMIGA
jgi:hypothetical protein